MKTHEQFADDLAQYALGELTGPECQELEDHLGNCAACRRELYALRGDLGLLGLSSSGAKPPARSRERLMQALAAEPRRVSSAVPAPAASPTKSWAWIPTLAAVLLAVAATILWVKVSRFNNEIVELSNRNQDQSVQLEQMNQELRLLTSPDAIHVSLAPQKAPRQPSGTAIYSPTQNRMLFLASNLVLPPAGKAYELWVIPATGAPIPAGVFKPDDHGNAVLTNRTIPEGVQAKAFAVTLENEAGSDKPTSPILLIGSGD